MRKKSRICLVILVVICMVLAGVAVFTKKIDKTDYDMAIYTYDETELGGEVNEVSKDYIPTEK